MKRTDARLAIALAGKRLSQESHGGQTFHVAAAAPLRVPRAPAFLLPAFDEFLVGYADRTAVIDELHAVRLNAGGGMLAPTIVVDGQVVGTWKRRLGGGQVLFTPAPFEPLKKAHAAAVVGALQRFARFLGLVAAPDHGC